MSLYQTLFGTFLITLAHIQLYKTETIVCKLIDQIAQDIYICPEISIFVTKGINQGQGTLIIRSTGNTLIDLISFPELNLDLEAETYVLHLQQIYMVPEVSYAQVLAKIGATPSDFHEIFVERCLYFNLYQIRDFNDVRTLHFIDLPNPEFGDVLSRFFPKLRTLIISNNSFSEAPSLSGLSELEEFSLESTYIRELPDRYFSENPHLKMISIGNIFKNIIHRIPRTLFQHLHQLHSLTLDANIHEFPIINGLKRMKELRLRLSSQPKTLPGHIFEQMMELKELKIVNSGIYKLQDDIFRQNHALKELQLHGNLIREIPPKIFQHNKNLSILNLAMNKIQEFNDTILPPQLEMFGLDFNPVRVYNMFTRLPDLSAIDFKNMNLTGELYLKHLSDFYPSLMIIRLSGNHIRKFIIELSSTFNGPELQIDLSRNKISTVELIEGDGCSHDWFSWRTRLKINLMGNPIKCDCSSKKFLQYLRSERNDCIQLVHDVRCDGLQWETLLTVDLDQIVC